MAVKETTIGGGTIFTGGFGQMFPSTVIPSSPNTITWQDLKAEFRKSSNEIESKVWFELDVTTADTIVIIHEGKRVEMDKKAFLQAIGLEW